MKGLAPVAAALALVLVGCGGSEIDGDALEAEITADAEERGLVLDEVDCPSPDTEGGDTFTCTVTVKGQPTDFDVLQTDDDGNVGYDFAALTDGPAVTDTAADEASIESVISTVNKDITAVCDYATRAFRKELAREEDCADAVVAKYESPFLEDYGVSVDGDHAAASAGSRTVTLARQKNGSWLITDVR